MCVESFIAYKTWNQSQINNEYQKNECMKTKSCLIAFNINLIHLVQVFNYLTVNCTMENFIFVEDKAILNLKPVDEYVKLVARFLFLLQRNNFIIKRDF